MSLELLPPLLIPVSRWAARGHLYPATDRAWRHLIRQASSNGLDYHGVIVRIGRRVLIDEAAFLRWARALAAPRQVPARPHTVTG